MAACKAVDSEAAGVAEVSPVNVMSALSAATGATEGPTPQTALVGCQLPNAVDKIHIQGLLLAWQPWHPWVDSRMRSETPGGRSSRSASRSRLG
ncbi:unnamed protein product, partial [Choristocarpus tenellus]